MGPRFLTTMLPFLACPLGLALKRFPGPTMALAGGLDRADGDRHDHPPAGGLRDRDRGVGALPLAGAAAADDRLRLRPRAGLGRDLACSCCRPRRAWCSRPLATRAGAADGRGRSAGACSRCSAGRCSRRSRRGCWGSTTRASEHLQGRRPHRPVNLKLHSGGRYPLKTARADRGRSPGCSALAGARLWRNQPGGAANSPGRAHRPAYTAQETGEIAAVRRCRRACGRLAGDDARSPGPGRPSSPRAAPRPRRLRRQALGGI